MSTTSAAPNDEELRRLNRAYRALTLCNGEIARATSEQHLLDALCETLVRVGGYPLTWIGFAEKGSFRIKPVALAGEAAARSYLDSIHVSWSDEEHGRGPTGMAFRTRQPAISRIYLPSATADHEELPPAVHVPATLHGTETVLLVEDDEQVRTLTRIILERHGYVVLDAQNAGEAFLTSEDPATSFDVLLTDIVLPRMSGRELAQRLIRTRPQLRVLFMSGYAEELVTTQDALGRAAFLQKPITPLLLLRKLREVLDAKQGASQ